MPQPEEGAGEIERDGERKREREREREVAKEIANGDRRRLDIKRTRDKHRQH